MATCPLCGKKIGIFENQISEFPDDPGVCQACHDTLSHHVSVKIKNLMQTGCTNDEIIKVIIKEFASSVNAENYLKNYINSIWFSKSIENLHKERLEALQKQAMSLLITTGYNFDGYKITDYKGVVSGETVIGTGLISEFLASVDDAMGMNSNSFSAKLRKVKENALGKLKIQSALAGGNAVIGVDFDYITFSNNMIGVSANGTAVVIEKLR